MSFVLFFFMNRKLLAYFKFLPVDYRCTAHGFLFSIGHLAGLIAAAIYANLTLHSYILSTLLTAVVAVTGTIFATRLIDSSSNLM